MAITGIMESSLLKSEVFIGINDEMKVQEKAINLIKSAKQLTNEDIEVAYIGVKQITDTLTRAALAAFDNGRTVLIYNHVPGLSLSQAVPFLTFNTKNGYKTYVFVDKYITVSREGVLNMSAPILRDLLIGALIANAIKRNYNLLASNQYLSKTLMGIYTDLVFRIINREFSIAGSKVDMDTCRYWINKYFLEVVFGSADTPENIDKLALSHVKYLDELQITEIQKKYTDASVSTLPDMLDLIKTISPRMKSLNMGIFLNDWINYYYIPATLACDNIEYLIFMCITLLSGNNIINISASDVVKEAKGIKAFRSELIKLIGG